MAGVVVAIGALGCGTPRPWRPASLPAEAQWAGAPKRGCWIIIGARDGAIWNLRVFDAKGRPHPVTRWRLQGFARTSLELQEIQSFDGKAFLLNDDAKLVPAP